MVLSPHTQTWIFLRGLSRATGHWGDFPERFAQAVPHSRVLPVELPGNGSLHRLSSPTRVSDMVAQARSQLQALGVAPPYAVLAMSLGAMVAVDWARAHPRELSHAVLINTSMRPFSPFYERLRPRQYARLLRLALGPASQAQWERAIFAMTTHLSRETLVAHWVDLRRQHPVSRVNTLRQLLAAARFQAPVRAPEVPMLVLGSEQDALVSVRCSQALAQAWGCELRRHPSAGHDLPQDDPDWVLRQTTDWLNAVVQASV